MLRCLLEDALDKKEVSSPDDTQKLNALVERLLGGEPLQYVTGVAWFYKMRFAVDPSVLIPRPETEELVEWVLDEFDDERRSVLDIGTGSGCIAVALKRMRPDWRATAWDVSSDALATASLNATSNSTDVLFEQRDVAEEAARSDGNAEQFDVVVSNPPYIARGEAHELDENVLAHEPHLALFAPPDDPLFFYNTI